MAHSGQSTPKGTKSPAPQTGLGSPPSASPSPTTQGKTPPLNRSQSVADTTSPRKRSNFIMRAAKGAANLVGARKKGGSKNQDQKPENTPPGSTRSSPSTSQLDPESEMQPISGGETIALPPSGLTEAKSNTDAPPAPPIDSKGEEQPPAPTTAEKIWDTVTEAVSGVISAVSDISLTKPKDATPSPTSQPTPSSASSSPTPTGLGSPLPAPNRGLSSPVGSPPPADRKSTDAAGSPLSAPNRGLTSSSPVGSPPPADRKSTDAAGSPPPVTDRKPLASPSPRGAAEGKGAPEEKTSTEYNQAFGAYQRLTNASFITAGTQQAKLRDDILKMANPNTTDSELVLQQKFNLLNDAWEAFMPPGSGLGVGQLSEMRNSLLNRMQQHANEASNTNYRGLYLSLIGLVIGTLAFLAAGTLYLSTSGMVDFHTPLLLTISNYLINQGFSQTWMLATTIGAATIATLSTVGLFLSCNTNPIVNEQEKLLTYTKKAP